MEISSASSQPQSQADPPKMDVALSLDYTEQRPDYTTSPNKTPALWNGQELKRVVAPFMGSSGGDLRMSGRLCGTSVVGVERNLQNTFVECRGLRLWQTRCLLEC